MLEKSKSRRKTEITITVATNTEVDETILYKDDTIVDNANNAIVPKVITQHIYGLKFFSTKY